MEDNDLDCEDLTRLLNRSNLSIEQAKRENEGNLVTPESKRRKVAAEGGLLPDGPEPQALLATGSQQTVEKKMDNDEELATLTLLRQNFEVFPRLTL